MRRFWLGCLLAAIPGMLLACQFLGGKSEDDLLLSPTSERKPSVTSTSVVQTQTIVATLSQMAVETLLPVTETGTSVWQPAPGITWQWQLTGLPVDLAVEAAVYDIDLFENEASIVAALHARGRRVICYISVGSWEDWRPDADLFPEEVIGKDYQGWPGEKWLDIRRIDLLTPILLARFDQCKAKGFDAIEPDNIDSFTNDTGFPLTYQDQLAFNIWLANQAHLRGLAIALKNDGDQVVDLLAYYDFAITEDCFTDEWCAQVTPFIQAGKAVLVAEYTDTGIRLQDFCTQAQAWGFSAILKHRDLDSWTRMCGS